MTTPEQVASNGRRLTPADVREVRFTRSSMLHPGYNDSEVDRFLDRVGEELGRLHAEKSELRDRVQALQAQVGEAPRREEPTAQAVSLLAVAQQTADQYVAEAETFSRVMVSEAQQQHDEQLQTAREKVGAMIQAAHEAAARIVAEGGGPAAVGDARTAQELQDQVAYLQAFGQACRTQLRSYLEALIGEVEQAWGRSDPAAVPVPGSPPQAARPAPPPGAPPPADGAASAQEPRTVEAAAVLLGEPSLGSAGSGPGQMTTGVARDRS